VRGLAHIGVIKALSELGVRPVVIAGTSVGSLVGAALAAGLDWQDVTAIARSVFWPSLLRGENLEKLCQKYLPETFEDLSLPFAAIATTLPAKKAVALTEGRLASAISASCALRIIRRPVSREGQLFKDGGIACVLPSLACRELGAEIVIASDVWELSSLLRVIRLDPTKPRGDRFYPAHYRLAVRQADLLIQPSVPPVGYLPGSIAVEKMIAAGERATHQALEHLLEAKAA